MATTTATPVSELPVEDENRKNKRTKECEEDVNLREMFYQGVNEFGAVRYVYAYVN